MGADLRIEIRAEPWRPKRRVRYLERRLKVSAEGADDGSPDEWTMRGDPAIRALLDHLAEELAAEFIELIRASTAAENDTNPEKEER